MDTTSKRDFFISYNPNDEAFAEWIAGVLEDKGYTTVIRAWDSRPGGNFVLDMQDAIDNTERTIAVLSPAYLRSEFAQAEWAARFVQDPASKRRRLIPVRVEACELTGLLRPLVCVELVGLGQAKARELLLSALAEERSKPDRPIDFPVLSIPHNLPRANELFVGREEALMDLHLRLQPDMPMAISSIKGMGGIGKTELALQYARKHLTAEGYAGGVCWLNAREELGTQIVSFARSRLQLQIPEDVELVEQVRLCWRWWQNSQTLVVFDDVQAYADIKPFLPPQDAQFRVLLTTRKYLDASVQSYEIAVLSEEASLELLRSLVSDGRVDRDLTTAKQVCEWLGYLPLGLELVGRYLARKRGTSIATLWERLQEKKLAAKTLIEAEPSMTASLGVTAAFELSWQELNPEAKRLAGLLSLFAFAAIPWALVQKCLPDVDEEDLEDLRDEQLVNLSLLSYERDETYQLHQLLREFFAVKRSQMPEDEVMKRSFCRVMVSVSEQILPIVTLAVIEQVASAIPHLKEAGTTLNSYLMDEDLITATFGLARFYEGESAFKEAEEWREYARMVAIARFGQNHPNVASSLQNLAGLYITTGRFSEAELLLLQALKIWEQHLGQHYSDTAITLNTLATVYRLQWQLDKAEPLYLKALQMRQKHLGQNHPDVAASLNSLGMLYYSKEQYAKAEPLYLEALRINLQNLGKNHIHTAKSLNNLAEIYRKQQRYAEAEPLYIEYLQICRKLFGKEHPDIAMGLNNLAELHADLRNYADAEELYLHSVTMFYKLLGEVHPYTQTVLKNLRDLLGQAVQHNRTTELSAHTLTRLLLQDIENGKL
ncbi:MAG: tetratricopeptide repeat protein [Phormidium tanganyikae FI6-MK23]|jgi:tetratricopeptide (TPR) repeat protein|nr:tetratricopeptide repeat protein [Phormidium tanganyikae FI6-MK23]